jgi:hypothetical protein
MDLPSSKFSWHKRSISEGSGSCPSSEATNSGGSDPSSSEQRNGAAALAQSSSRKGRGSGQGQCGERGSLGGPFIGAQGGEGGREVASTGELATAGMVVHSVDDGTARAGG